MTTRLRLTRHQRIRIWDTANGRCHLCGMRIHAERGERWEVEHKTPIWAGGADDPSNMAPAHIDCHKRKSGGENTDRSKADRQRANHLGIPKSRTKPLPGGRDSAIRKKINGEVVARKSQSQQHREMMERR